MSELAHRRYKKAATIKDATPEDTLEAALWEIRNENEPVDHVVVIRAHIGPDGLHYNVSQGGKFNIAERMGLIALVSQRVVGD